MADVSVTYRIVYINPETEERLYWDGKAFTPKEAHAHNATEYAAARSFYENACDYGAKEYECHPQHIIIEELDGYNWVVKE